MSAGYRLASFPYGFRADFDTSGVCTYPTGKSNLARLNWLTSGGTFNVSGVAHTDNEPWGAYEKNGLDSSFSDSGSWTRDISGYSGFDGATMASLIDVIAGSGAGSYGAQFIFSHSGTVMASGSQVYSTDPAETRTWQNYRWTYQFHIGWDPSFGVVRPQGMDTSGNLYVYCWGSLYFEAELIDSVTGSLGYSSPCGGATLSPFVADPPDLSGSSAVFKRGSAGVVYVDPMGYNTFGAGGDLGQEWASSNGSSNGITSAQMDYSVSTIYTPKNSF